MVIKYWDNSLYFMKKMYVKPEMKTRGVRVKSYILAASQAGGVSSGVKQRSVGGDEDMWGNTGIW
jgi:hypothetical protein